MGINGFGWGAGQSLRWGTNLVSDSALIVLDTNSFATVFDEVGTDDESQGVTGDSGGAVFQKIGSDWQLVGILFAIGSFAGQPSETSLFGNVTYAADLASYREQILTVASTPSCSDGLDDDGDGFTDWPNDPGCRGPSDPSETGVPALPAASGWSWSLLLGLLLIAGWAAAGNRIAPARVRRFDQGCAADTSSRYNLLPSGSSTSAMKPPQG